MMPMALFFLLLPALAAVMAGWRSRVQPASGAGRRPPDPPVLVAMTIFVLVLVGVSKSHPVRMRLDPSTSCKPNLPPTRSCRRCAKTRRTTPRSLKTC